MASPILTEKLIKEKTKAKSLSDVRQLDLWGEGLTEVSVVSQLTRVQVLALAVNQIDSLQPFAQCVMLEELYLRKNTVSNLREVAALRSLKGLHTLWLMDNPCAKHPLYREFVLHCCQGLKQLDKVEVTAEERAAAEKKLSRKALEEIMGSSKECSSGHDGAGDHSPPSALPTSTPLSNVKAKNTTASLDSSSAISHGGNGKAASSDSILEERSPRGRTVLFTTVQAQRAMLTSIVSLLPELTAESLELLEREVHNRVEHQRAKLKAKNLK